MAELPELGQQCSFPLCNQIDFLPLNCDQCKSVFCKHHFPVANHGCPVQPEPVKKPSLPTSPRVQHPCELEGCQELGNELKPLVVCRLCQKSFCMGHRNELDHLCQAKVAADGPHVMAKTREMVTGILAKNSENPKSIGEKKISAKNAKMAAKVQLMKLKQKSDGNKSIPQDERIYLRVLYSVKKSEKIESKNIFVSSKWPVGKILDHLAASCQIENPNNVSMSKRRLKIFRQIDGHIWWNDMSISLESLVKSEDAFNGETIILEYSDDAEVEFLPEDVLKPYKNVKL